MSHLPACGPFCLCASLFSHHPVLLHAALLLLSAGVEAGKKAAAEVLSLQKRVQAVVMESR